MRPTLKQCAGPISVHSVVLAEPLESRILYSQSPALSVNTTSGSQVRQSVASPITIMPLGDSITAGAYSWGQASGGYRLPLYEDLKSDGLAFRYVGSQTDSFCSTLISAGEADYEGHPGFRADELANNLLGVDNSHTGSNGGHWLNGTGARPAVYPNIVLLEAGTNDILEGDSVSEAAAHIHSLLQILTTARPQARILIGTLLPIDESPFLPEVQQLNAVIRNSLVPSYQKLGKHVTLVDQYKNFINAQGNVISSLLYDHVHPIESGYQAMANSWASAIVSVERPTPTPGPNLTPTVTGFDLLNASTNAVLGTISNGKTIKLSQVGAKRINVAGLAPQARSMTFSLNGVYQGLTSTVPLTLVGAEGGSNFDGLGVGDYTLIVQAFSGIDATGKSSSFFKVQFKIVS